MTKRLGKASRTHISEKKKSKIPIDNGNSGTLEDHDEKGLFLMYDRHVKIVLCIFLKAKNVPGRMA